MQLYSLAQISVAAIKRDLILQRGNKFASAAVMSVALFAAVKQQVTTNLMVSVAFGGRLGDPDFTSDIERDLELNPDLAAAKGGAGQSVSNNLWNNGIEDLADRLSGVCEWLFKRLNALSEACSYLVRAMLITPTLC